MLLSGNTKKTANFLRSTLVRWFDRNGRDFTWRREHDAFKILIAEMMLQRTKAQQVQPVYSDFLVKFSNIESVAKSEIEEILPLVRRIGLFRRGIIFIEMARSIMAKHDGVIPPSREQLLEIPGIGDYIADALIIYAFGGKRIAVDTNVVRLISRFYGLNLKGEGRRDKRLIELCDSLLVGINNSTLQKLNWALIDFAALICKTKPLCSKCPLASRCTFVKNNLIQ